jgi:uncharacterized membrane protein YebE (DUF533 family)
MYTLVELILLSAAVDGHIDEAEKSSILKSFAQHRDVPSISEGQISAIKQQLLERLQQGFTHEGVIQNAAHALTEDKRILSYAIAVEVVLSNNELTKSEREYLKLHRETLKLDKKQVESIHFSAKVRYGFGEFN